MNVALQHLMPHCQSVWYVNKVPNIVSELLEVPVFCLKPHGPMQNQGTKSVHCLNQV